MRILIVAASEDFYEGKNAARLTYNYANVSNERIDNCRHKLTHCFNMKDWSYAEWILIDDGVIVERTVYEHPLRSKKVFNQPAADKKKKTTTKLSGGWAEGIAQPSPPTPFLSTSLFNVSTTGTEF